MEMRVVRAGTDTNVPVTRPPIPIHSTAERFANEIETKLGRRRAVGEVAEHFIVALARVG